MKIFASIIVLLISCVYALAQVPSTPVLTQTSASLTANIFTWPDVATETSYRLEIRTGDGSWSTATTPAQNIVTSTHTSTFTRNVPYSYRLFAVNGSGDSVASNIVFTTLPPSPLPTPSTSTTDIFAEPTLPTLPAKGGTVYDPTFGTPITRISDSTDAANVGNTYSYWSSFNCVYAPGSCAGTGRILVRNLVNGDAYFQEHNPTTGALGAKVIPSPAQSIYWGSGDYWHLTDSDLIYGLNLDGTNPSLMSYKPTTNAYVTAKNFAGIIPANRFLDQVSMSTDRTKLAATVKNATTFLATGFIAYNLTNNTVLITSDAQSDVNEVYVDRGGRYVIVVRDGPQRHDIYDTQNGNSLETIDYVADNGIGHSTVLDGFIVGQSNSGANNDLARWTLGNVLATRTVLQTFTGAPGAIHASILASDAWTFFSTYRGMAQGHNKFLNELMLVKNDGSGNVFRFAHHGSKIDLTGDYYYHTPRANSSRNGIWFAFTSDWGNYLGRLDMFIAKVETSPLAQLNVVCNWHTGQPCN